MEMEAACASISFDFLSYYDLFDTTIAHADDVDTFLFVLSHFYIYSYMLPLQNAVSIPYFLLYLQVIDFPKTYLDFEQIFVTLMLIVIF